MAATLERERRDQLAAKVGISEARPVRLVPELPVDIHDLAGLEALRASIFGADPPFGEPPVPAFRES
jgi:hypothetical protein